MTTDNIPKEVKHTQTPCRRNNMVHFHTKSYSDEFECPACGLRRRFNLNYLSNRRAVLCDGTKLTPTARLDFADWRALTDEANNLAVVKAGGK